MPMGMPMPIELSIVVPFRDEAASLEPLYRELAGVLDEIPRSAEMIFVDDDSRDDGRGILIDATAGDSRVRVLALSPHGGQSAALEAGFRAARGEVVAMLDADLQNDPADLPRLLDALSYADCVNGVRVDRRDRRARRWASGFANAVRRRVLGDAVSDIGCSLRVARASFVQRIKLHRGLHRFLPVLLWIEGARLIEIPVHHRPRRFGRSKYGIARRLAVVWVDLLAVFWMKRRATRYEVKELSRRA